MTPAQYYREQLQLNEITADPSQAAAIAALQTLYNSLLQRPPPANRKNGVLPNLFRRNRVYATPEKGLYIWGGVGRGKSWLADIFYNLLPFEEKLRIHFHQFMREIHQELTSLSGEKEPLDKVAENLAERTRVLCLDEFIVTDIGDAMIITRLLKAIFSHGIILVTSSNTQPQELYKDGLQRASFLPAIELLKQHTRILKLDAGTDYRLRYLEQATVYHTPLSPEVDLKLLEEFSQLAQKQEHTVESIHVFGRDIPVKHLADDVIWFDFIALCGPPRSQADYLELSRCFHTVLISDIPVLGPSMDDATRRFLYLVDEFYDRGVKLIISAAEPPESLYQGERLAFDFQRASSRLREMQSKAYLSGEHKS
ncbi:cell division protein ZapE [Candidatus Vondammii sp. HM_W22]|uniref:cell division protein ZapE n=1 Tax=Candidatus Vondammii sp. HM_W22 TaxID=2687299 RepID=UPI001F13956E|nr:cell division protein ZapE [Candidatus Vondammii sp. HM_W22]